jgi:hypothetical protein
MDDQRTVCPVFILHVQLAKSKVAQGDVAGVVQQNIFRLQVSVNDIEAMKTLQRTEQLGSVKPRPVNVEPLLFLEVMEQLSTIDKRQNEVELLWRLEGELERYNERVVDLRQNRSFGKCVGHFGPRNNVSFPNRLERIDTMRITLPACMSISPKTKDARLTTLA